MFFVIHFIIILLCITLSDLVLRLIPCLIAMTSDQEHQSVERECDVVQVDVCLCQVIGRLELGGKSTGSALHHWAEVSNSPRRQIAEWHKLRE